MNTPTTTALAAAPAPTIRQIIALVDELANVSTPTPASGIVRLGLVTELRAELRPSLGSTGPGRGGSARIPIDPSTLALWEDVTGRIQALPVDLGDEPATHGSVEQILNAWARDLVAADTEARARQELNNLPADGLSDDARSTVHRRLERIRFLIADHFNPPRRAEYPFCPEPDCRATHVQTEVDGENIQQRALTLLVWPDSTERPPQATCAACGTTWTGYDAIRGLNDTIEIVEEAQRLRHAAAARVLRDFLLEHPLPHNTEAELQDALDERTGNPGLTRVNQTGAVIAAQAREVTLDPRNRIDFLTTIATQQGTTSIGVEVKIHSSTREVLRQLTRYAKSDTIDALILVTTKAKHHNIPDTLEGKPVILCTLVEDGL